MDSMGYAYDYESVMHYGSKFFTKNDKVTIRIRKSGLGNIRIGQRKRLSDIDVAQINAMYNCNKIATGNSGNFHRQNLILEQTIAGFGIRNIRITLVRNMRIWSRRIRRISIARIRITRVRNTRIRIRRMRIAGAKMTSGFVRLCSLIRVFFSPAKCIKTQTKDGRDYDGKLSYTEKGVTCQAWNSNWPHRNSVYTGNYWFDYKLGLMERNNRHHYMYHNYCRNPGGRRKRPWCYTTLTKPSWQYCDLKIC